MAKGTGLPIGDCRRFIQNYYARYYRVKEWQDELNNFVVLSRTMSDRRVGGQQAGKGGWKSETGREYVFYEQIAPEWLRKKTGRNLSFSPTQIKNYPVQGFATADVVPLMLGRVNRLIQQKYRDVILLVNTIHDSILLDVDQKNIDTITGASAGLALDEIHRLLESAPKCIEETFGLTFDMELPVDMELGPNWAEMISVP